MNKNIENMSEEERIAFLKLRELIIKSHEEWIKRREKLDNWNSSWSKPWFSI